MLERVGAYAFELVKSAASGSQSLEDLCRSCGGLYPTDVLQVLDDPWFDDGEHSDRLRQWTHTHPRLSVSQSRLPVPHPLDFEWWFSESTCDHLIATLLPSPDTPQTLALLGTPRLAEVLARHSPTRAEIHLFERRADAAHALRDVAGGRIEVHVGDVAVTGEALSHQADVAIADPPWYPRSIATFLHAAAGVLKPLGRLFICCPGLATRPAVPEERTRLLDLAHRCGFALERLAPAILVYESPPFELVALRAAGLEGFDPYWRRGDLMSFRRVPGVEPALPPSGPSADDDRWEEVTWGRARVRVNTADPPLAAGLLDNVVEGDVLDSVSTRDPRRALVNVWTGTNRVFRSGRPTELLAALGRVARGVRREDPPDEVAGQLLRVESSTLALLGVE